MSTAEYKLGLAIGYLKAIAYLGGRLKDEDVLKFIKELEQPTPISQQYTINHRGFELPTLKPENTIYGEQL